MEQVFIDLGDKIQIKIKHLKINTILACHTYDANNNIVKEAYSPFTKEDIDGIINSGIEEIYYSKKDASAYQPLYEKNLKDYLNKNVYKGPRTIALETQKTAIKAVDNIISKAKENTNIDFNLSQSAVNSI
ncbi:MAG: hypothetical protein OEV44_13565 [Spirochaetota bacterium]|nr:hypothetical protein [Spirochaetota bacterium]